MLPRLARSTRFGAAAMAASVPLLVPKVVANDEKWKAGIGNDTSTNSQRMSKVYDDWGNAYNNSVRSWGYDAPERTTAIMKAAFAGRAGGWSVLDAGCGSGLQADSLLKAGFGPLIGIDVSQALLDQATATCMYQNVFIADLNKPLHMFETDSFDASTCCGVLTYIDPKNTPSALEEFARVVRPGGFVSFTSRDDMAKSWEMIAEDMVQRGIWRLHHNSGPVPYLPGNPDYKESVLVIIYCYEVLK